MAAMVLEMMVSVHLEGMMGAQTSPGLEVGMVFEHLQCQQQLVWVTSIMIDGGRHSRAGDHM